jgi:hypothetical protein
LLSIWLLLVEAAVETVQDQPPMEVAVAALEGYFLHTQV